MADIIQIRRGTAATWTSVDPVLADGELGIEKDTSKFKSGDGVTVWSSLPYFGTAAPVDSVNGYTGTVVLDTDDVSEGASNKYYPGADATKVGHISVTQAVDLDQMETDIAALANGMVYKDDWDASSGSFPGGGAAQIGWFYNVSVAGTVDGVEFAIGDSIIAKVDNASTATYAANWVKKDQTDAVQSVAGKVGAVVLNAADITDFDTEVSNNVDVTANTAKVGISPTQASDITTNNAKVGITPTQASNITTNNAKVGVTTEERNTINSVTLGEPPGSDVVLNVVSLTQDEYDLGTPVATTFYVIVEDPG